METRNQSTFNADTIVGVRLVDATEDTDYRWFEKSKFIDNFKIFKHFFKESGFYYKFLGCDFIAPTVEEFLAAKEECLTKPIGYYYGVREDGKTVYQRPRVIIKFANGKSLYEYFQTYEEAKAYYKKITDMLPNKFVIEE